MKSSFYLIAALTLAGCMHGTEPARTPAQQQGETRMFTQADFAQLRFLEGRWSGRAPDGSTFYEAYDFPADGQMRSRRFTNERFEEASDGSSIALADGVITSTWGEFTWRATEVSDGFVAFDPVNAPSRFSWRRVGDGRVDVVQNWTDAEGSPQTYTVPLTRIGG